MPNYAQMNVLENTDIFLDRQNQMNCMSHAINQSLDEAYAHHIQRLHGHGNFTLLTQIHPDEVDAWYLEYIDAIEWVEMPNTRDVSIC
jgi:deoxyribodipyrimidine photolyase-related protein